MHVLLNRLLNSRKRDEKRLSNSNASSATTLCAKKSMKKKIWMKTKQNKTAAAVNQQEQQKQQELLTQCISNALFVTPPSSESIRFQETVQEKKPRVRKLSLPPQLNHIGYLASIPEAEDSQVTLYKQQQ